ncbi:hypothetical protein SAMN04488093_102609 [Tropicibacter naphthalenivorans]|uniref:Histidine kinase n=2 Tax=Tropicibacter naphthalenivorans TaxID=441103 RepID=A0A0P1G435_9RHOB|nr:hypothetical protein TRN7648_01009 [Tropicibacter naphthalenivorans]SMC64967.1 hypothetical protein SAMN04488093_102609 [Tropicibacter naphthalenivorans]
MAFTIISAFAVGFGVYYTQVYAFYSQIEGNGTTDVMLTPVGGGAPEVIAYSDFQAIDRESSPLAYRACFTTTQSLAMLTETFEMYERAVPRISPAWFECFDAQAAGDAIEADKAVVFTGQRNIEFGIDRVVAITEDGRGYIWQEINECGDKAYDGSPLGEDCPER